MPDDELALLTDQTVQARATQEMQEGGPFAGVAEVFAWLAHAGGTVAPWWSRVRDKQLSMVWRQSDALSSAMDTLQNKLTSIPFKVEPVDPSCRAHIKQAEEYEQNLWDMTDFGVGWTAGIKPAIEDLFGQDNGLFIEVIGEGQKDKPLVGSALGIAPLDAEQCVRTTNPEFPVVYYDPLSGSRFKLHHTRVMSAAQMPSARSRMNRVGFCAVSRCIQAAQNLMDIATFKMEKLGSRPKRQILVGRKGLTADDITLAFKAADTQMDNMGLSRAAQTVVIAPRRALGNVEIQLDQIDLASVPDGFNEQESVTLGVYFLAWAFGVDAREFWPATSSGATKADAMVQHMKARGKAIGNTISLLEQLLNRYYLPTHLKMKFDVQDDEEDQQRAAIQDTRSTTHDRDMKGSVYSVRIARQMMVNDGHMTPEQFEEAELADGRLEGGEDVLSLFYSSDPLVSNLLNLRAALDYAPSGEQAFVKATFDPLDKEALTWEMLAPTVDSQRRECLRILAQQVNAATTGPRRAAKQALSALDALDKYYNKPTPPTPAESKPAGAEGEKPAGQVDEASQGAGSAPQSEPPKAPPAVEEVVKALVAEQVGQLEFQPVMVKELVRDEEGRPTRVNIRGALYASPKQ